jgi:hypothetical protein
VDKPDTFIERKTGAHFKSKKGGTGHSASVLVGTVIGKEKDQGMHTVTGREEVWGTL